MPKNIEFKARLRDREETECRVRGIADGPAERIRQVDTFFRVDRGRLKLRVLDGERGELIFYERSDACGPRASTYWIHGTSDPESLQVLLSAGLGARGTVRKERWLYRVGRTRVHLDDVERLGAFLEIEVVLSEDETEAEGRAVALRLMGLLGVGESDLVEHAYIDLLEEMGVLEEERSEP